MLAIFIAWVVGVQFDINTDAYAEIQGNVENRPELARDHSRQKKNRSAPLRGQGAPAFPAHLRS